jgi:NAD-dependent SIR2 family protein deacetylase
LRVAIFLGGGASAAEGAPMQTEVFYEYFRMVNEHPKMVTTDMVQEINAYFSEVFGIDTGIDHQANQFPTFEEALGILDLAVRRREALKNFDLENISKNSNRIGFMRQYMVLLLATVLNYKIRDNRNLHKTLVTNLYNKGIINETVFITTNYDVLIDEAISNIKNFKIDYGFDFSNLNSPDSNRRVILYKLHGSLNWLYCPACNEILHTGSSKPILQMIDNRGAIDCQRCQSIMLPVIIPPTFYKDMSNVYLNTVWNKAELTLREVDRLIFCGYSFPDADMHIKYLIKRIQTNRLSTSSLDFIVINHHQGKNIHIAEKEKARFLRFLGKGVNYTSVCFEEFAANPLSFIQ